MKLRLLRITIIVLTGLLLISCKKSNNVDQEITKLIDPGYPTENYQNLCLNNSKNIENTILNFDRVEREYNLTIDERAILLRKKAYFYKLIDLERSLSYALESYDVLNSSDNSEERFKTAICLANLYSFSKNYQQTDLYIGHALEIAQRLANAALIRDAYTLRINNLMDEQKYNEAIAVQLKSISYFKHSIDSTYNKIAFSYVKLKDYQKAKIYYYKILNRKGISDLTRDIAHSNLAKCYLAENKNDSAMFHYQQAFVKLQSNEKKITYVQLSSLTDYSKLLWEKGNHNQAILFLRAVMNYHYEKGVDQKDYITALTQLISYYSLDNRGIQALEVFNKLNKVNHLIQDEQNNAYNLNLSRTFKFKEIITKLESQEKSDTLIFTEIAMLIIILISGGGVFFGYKFFKRKDTPIIVKEEQKLKNQTNVPASQPVCDQIEDNNIELYRQIEQYMIKEKPFINNHYSLEDLSRDIYSNRSYISAAINTGYGKNFNQWLNKHRVEHLIQQINVGLQKNQSLDLNELAYSSGFASQTSFYRAFKSITNMTPLQYHDLYTSRQLVQTEPTKLTENI